MVDTTLRPYRSDTLRFFASWIRRPAAIGAILPSGKALAAAMAAEIDTERPGCVLELGGGTGTITRACLAAGVISEDLIVVEREPALCRLIATRFPGVRVICGDACDLAALVRANELGPVKAVVSGLPLLNMPHAARRRIINAAFAVMLPDAVFLQFTYGPASPIPGSITGNLKLIGSRAAWVAKNLPPASVWRYSRAPVTGGNRVIRRRAPATPSAGSARLFASVLRRRLPAPVLRKTPPANRDDRRDKGEDQQHPHGVIRCILERYFV